MFSDNLDTCVLIPAIRRYRPHPWADHTDGTDDTKSREEWWRQYNQTTDQRGALLLDSDCYIPPLLGAQDQAVETATRVECDAYQKPELCWAVFHFPGDTQTRQHTTESLARDIRGAQTAW